MKLISAIILRIRASFGLSNKSKIKLDRAMTEWREFMVNSDIHNLNSVIEMSASEKDLRFGANLNNFGIAIVPDFLDRQVCFEISESVFADLNKLRQTPRASEWRNAKVLNPDDVSTGYSSMALSREPIINLRGGSDLGMVDVFNPEKLYPQIEELVDGIRSSSIEDVISKVSGTKMALQNVNLYVNADVQQTRGFHVDSWGVNQFKAFVYLTDVNALADGPYTYVLESPNDGELEVLNKQLNLSFRAKSLTDVRLFDPSKVMPVLAEAGSLVVSNQTGAHGGWPQKEGHKRCVLALNFREA